MSAKAIQVRRHLMLALACGLWNKAGVGSNPSFITCQCHGLGVVIDPSGTGLIKSTVIRMHEIMLAKSTHGYNR